MGPKRQVKYTKFKDTKLLSELQRLLAQAAKTRDGEEVIKKLSRILRKTEQTQDKQANIPRAKDRKTRAHLKDVMGSGPNLDHSDEMDAYNYKRLARINRRRSRRGEAELEDLPPDMTGPHDSPQDPSSWIL